MYLYQGIHWNIEYARRDNRRYPAKTFIEGLGDNEHLRFLALLKKVADEPRIVNVQRLTKKLRGAPGIRQLRSGDYRLFCFQFEKTFVLTNGFYKDQNSTDRTEIQKAIDIKAEYLKRKQI